MVLVSSRWLAFCEEAHLPVFVIAPILLRGSRTSDMIALDRVLAVAVHSSAVRSTHSSPHQRPSLLPKPFFSQPTETQHRGALPFFSPVGVARISARRALQSHGGAAPLCPVHANPVLRGLLRLCSPAIRVDDASGAFGSSEEKEPEKWKKTRPFSTVLFPPQVPRCGCGRLC